VQSVSAVSKLPSDGGSARTQTIVIENRPLVTSGEYPTANFQGISPDYFRAMGTPLLRGRAFAESDVLEAPPVIIINETMAKRYFPNEDPIGKRLAMGGRNSPGQADTAGPGSKPFGSEIVGVVRDTKKLNLNADTVPDIFVPYWQWPMQSPALLVRLTGDPAAFGTTIRSEVKAVNSRLPTPKIRTMDDILADTVAQPRFHTLLSGLFGFTALVLAAIGIYGVMAYSVTQRTHEIGIRMALGARKGNVLSLVIRQGMKLTLIGVAVGVVAALALTRVMRNLLYEVDPTDPLTFVAVPLFLICVALVACWLPARRAAKVDPMVALRHE
jgi:putative ABC transport system permease protein